MQIFEKMISGMYMGELIRQVLIDLMKDDLIFLGLNRDCVNCPQHNLLESNKFIFRYK